MADMNMPRRSLLYCQVCAPKNSKFVDIEKYANEENPTGIDSKWRLDTSVEQTQCEKYPENVHHLLNC